MDKYNLVHEDEKWKLKKEGGKHAIDTFAKKSEALKQSVDYVKERGGSLKIRRQDNAIQEERTYPRSKDPKKSKG